MKNLLQSLLLALSLTLPVAAIAASDGHAHHNHTMMAKGAGVLKAVDAKSGTLMIAHEAIPSLKWKAMTMPFKLLKPEMAKGLQVGQNVQFELAVEGTYGVIVAIQPK